MRKLLALFLAGILSLLSAGCEQSPPPPQAQDEISRPLPAFEALRAGELTSILVVGDSISDGNSDKDCLWTQEDRAARGYREILTDENGESYYENPVMSQGWVKYLRTAAEEAGVTLFENDAIGGMSAKWFNAHKEQLFAAHDRYDAIFVMLGTNDRWACADPEEFHAEYGALLAYLSERCTYLTVLTPIPALLEADRSMPMNTEQIADEVRALCEENGYACIDCYRDFPQHAADEGLPLGYCYWGGTHPNTEGYRVLWETIAAEPEGTGQPEDPLSLSYLGANREDLTGDTPADAVQADGTPLYPDGVSWYFTWNPFTNALPSGAYLETHRDADTAVQYAYDSPLVGQEPFVLVRTWQDGAWSDWADA